MERTKSHPPPATAARRFVLGRARFEQISAVEGIVTAPETRHLLDTLESAGATAEQRRTAIVSRFIRPR